MSVQPATPVTDLSLRSNIDFLSVAVFSLVGLVMAFALLHLADTDLSALMFAG